MWRLGNVFSPVLFDLIVTAEQFSSGDVILHVTGRLNWVWGASVLILELHEFISGHDSIMVMLFGLVMLKLWNRGSLFWWVVAFMDLSAQQIRLTKLISLLNAFVWSAMILFLGRSKYLVSLLFTGIILSPVFITSSLDFGSTVDTSRVVRRSLEEQWVDEALVGTRVVITIAVFSAMFNMCWVS